MDLQDILDFTMERFGSAQAEKYIHGLFDVFDRLVENPAIGRARLELVAGLRSFPSGSHVIFFMVFVEEIVIVRVLHGARDVKKAFVSGE